MILVDSRIGSAEVLPYIKRYGVPAEKTILPYGDFMMEGNGPKGRINIGVERKTLHDMLHCIDDARYIAQRQGMLEMYEKSFLLVEGFWKPDENGTLYEGFKGGSFWGPCKYRTQRVMYSKLRRYLFSIALSGVVVIYSRDITQTGRDLCEMFHYFSKPWDKHTSLLEISKLAIPDMRGKPSLVRRWAADLTDIGVKLSLDAERIFKTPYALATSDESRWLSIRGVGVQMAKNIIREIHER